MSVRGFADDAMAGEYAGFLIGQHEAAAAAAAWRRHLGARAGDYLTSNYLFNGDFESKPTPAPFDWRIVPAEGVEAVRSSESAFSGRHSLRIAFSGTANVARTGVSQVAYVEPGRSRFQAYVRTEGITTDEGLRLRVFDLEAPGRLDLRTGQFSGTTEWTKVELSFVMPSQTRVVQIEAIREPSLKFDHNIRGVAWIDAVKLWRAAP